MSEIVIVQADLLDDRHVNDVLAMLDHYAEHAMGQGRPLDDSARSNLIPGLREHPTTLVLLAYEGEKPVGVALCFRGFSSFKARPLLNIHDFAVHEDARGKGVGRRLMEAVFEKATQLGCCRVTLEVAVANEPAKSLYLKTGFEPGDPTSTAQWFWTKHLD